MKSTEQDSIYYLEKAPVPGAILHMAVPMIMGMILGLVYNVIDAYFIGRLGNTAMMAAITLAFPIEILVMGIGQIYGSGGGTLIPRLLGDKNFEEVKQASSVNFYLALLSGIVLMLVLVPTLTPMLSLIGATGEALRYTRDFALILALGSPLIITNMALSETIRGEGAATASMTGMILSVVVNILLDPVFIFFLKMNVMGAALATVIANAAAVAYFVWYIQAKSKVQSIRIKDFRPNKEILSNIYKIGSAAFLFSALAIISTSMFNTYALGYGDNVIAAFGIANRVVQICEFLGSGLFTGVVPLIAYAYAAGNRKRLNQVVYATTLFFVGITLILGGTFMVFRQQIFSLFSKDLGVLVAGYKILTAMLVSTLFTGFTSIISNMFEAFGAGIQANIMAVVRGLVLIPIIYLGNQMLGLNGVIWSLPAAEISACFVGMLLWLASGRKYMAVPLEKRKELVPGME
ncbi:MAG TPA: MATE family efflux transporter [Anaerolineales bacterium]|nr:MATE family efflux transporter [Anaerolineales bacterium]